MTMINMLRTVEDMKEEEGLCSPSCCEGEEERKPEYPYGLRLCLAAPELRKLALDLAPIGAQMKITAIVKVVEARKSADEQNERKSMDLQITDLELQRAAAEIDPRKMYPSMI